MIKTKCIHDPAETEDGDRILVCRYWPRGISREKLRIEEWMRGVAPSPELLDNWREGELSWTEYWEQYVEEMSSQEKQIDRLAEKAREGTITLLCHEPEHNPHCHRHILKKLISAEAAEEN